MVTIVSLSCTLRMLDGWLSTKVDFLWIRFIKSVLCTSSPSAPRSSVTIQGKSNLSCGEKGLKLLAQLKKDVDMLAKQESDITSMFYPVPVDFQHSDIELEAVPERFCCQIQELSSVLVARSSGSKESSCSFPVKPWCFTHVRGKGLKRTRVTVNEHSACRPQVCTVFSTNLH